jgi:hypothetical protein
MIPDFDEMIESGYLIAKKKGDIRLSAGNG